MSKKIRTEAVDQLFEAILCLKDKEECYTFFEDVCTINELLSLSQRFEVAKMLMDKRTYLDISEKTGASTATISRVNRCLIYGFDGYVMVVSRIAEIETIGVYDSGRLNICSAIVGQVKITCLFCIGSFRIKEKSDYSSSGRVLCRLRKCCEGSIYKSRK